MPSTNCRGSCSLCAYLRPDGLVGMTPKSVKKKLKQPSFATAVNREELRRAAEDLGVEFDEHLFVVIAALTASGGPDGRRPERLGPRTGPSTPASRRPQRV